MGVERTERIRRPLADLVKHPRLLSGYEIVSRRSLFTIIRTAGMTAMRHTTAAMTQNSWNRLKPGVVDPIGELVYLGLGFRSALGGLREGQPNVGGEYVEAGERTQAVSAATPNVMPTMRRAVTIEAAVARISSAHRLGTRERDRHDQQSEAEPYDQQMGALAAAPRYQGPSR